MSPRKTSQQAPQAELTVTSWAQLQETLFEDSHRSELARFRSNYAFRGMADIEWGLETSLMRLGGPYVNLEQPMLRSFQKYAHEKQAPGNAEWNRLSLAQHHGLPTRLMDWTYSPFVAMHFATDDMRLMQKDGVIWCIDFVHAAKYLPPLFNSIRNRHNAVTFSVDMMNEAAPSLDALRNLKKEDFVVFFEPPSLDDRIINQYALFSVMPRADAKLETWLREQQRRDRQLWRKITIPARLKWEIRDKLDQANITERVLFGGLDGLCRWLRRHYGPGPRATTTLK